MGEGTVAGWRNGRKKEVRGLWVLTLAWDTERLGMIKKQEFDGVGRTGEAKDRIGRVLEGRKETKKMKLEG